MNKIKRGVGLLSFAVLSLFAVSAMAADREEITGHLNSVDQYESSINVQVEAQGLAGPIIRDLNLDLAADVRWVICLGTSCAEKTGIEGAWMLKEYAAYEPYGIMVDGSEVTMIKSEDAITEVWVALR